MKKTKKRGVSLNLQITIAFLGLIVMIIAICIVMNSFFLEKYYIKNKQTALKSAYTLMNDAFNNGNYDSDAMDIEIRRVCATYNLSMVVLDESTDTVMASMDDANILSRQLLNHLFGEQMAGTDENGDAPEPPKDQNGEPPATVSGNMAPDSLHVNVDRILEQTDSYKIEIGADFRSGDQYLEMWGILDNGDIFLMRSAVNSISDSISISNRFLVYIGMLIAVVGMIVSVLISRKLSKPLKELADISEKMRELDFNVKYTGKSRNEIGILGENINELSETLEKTISELKTANNELTLDLERKTKIDDMRKEFLSNVSHELKTPLALIQGYAEGLKDCVADDEESRNFYCDVIMDESAKMNTMVKKLLTLNQLEFGADSVTIERFDIVTLIRNYIQSADILIKQNSATVSMTQTEPIDVWADEFKTEEVFTNYFSNALNHLDGERKIDVTFRRIGSDRVRVSVFNTGTPIPEDSLDKVWDKFYKVDKARTREYGGSGVGLSIVKAIQESMNQAYGVINYNNGVEFYFELDTSGRA